ncbi:hypothetical protein GGS26DRAFT_603219 [Hypomontagnella submonticulosa]|nr:hypothetical protein GGS26DRAFT_603219 [Hypomontagnella submonticulosa]
MTQDPLKDEIDSFPDNMNEDMWRTILLNHPDVYFHEYFGGSDAEPEYESDSSSGTDPYSELVSELDDMSIARSDIGSDAGSDVGSDDESDDGSDTDSDAGSVTSSIMYSQEPFESFQYKALTLARTKVWADAGADEVTVERLLGGGYNRIIGLTRQSVEQPEAKTQYILRIPRFEYNHDAFPSDVASLLFLHKYTTIPAPSVVSFDDTTTNELEQPYMIQNRIAGSPLYSAYPNMSHLERCRLATELGCAYRKMLAVRSSTSGKLSFPTDDISIQAPLQVTPWCPADGSVRVPFSTSAAPHSVFEMLIASFKAWRVEELRLRPQNLFTAFYIDRFTTMVEELDDAGFLDNVPYSLAHLDLAPRNVMVNPSSDVEQSIISAIIDWDSAIIGPMFMTCMPPVWLWAYDREDESDEEDSRGVIIEKGWGETTCYSAETREDQELKDKFEEAAGPDYMRFAYNPVYSLARRLVLFIVDGLRSNETLREADAMFSEWDKIKKGGV